jgi:hypothetical protein
VFHGLRFVLPVLLLTAGACARSTGGETAAADASAKVEVRVNNQNALPMEVYASGSGINHRMGTVYPGMDAHFTVPQNLVGGGSVVFEVRPSGGGRAFRSGELLLTPRSLIQILIASQLFSSTVNQYD